MRQVRDTVAVGDHRQPGVRLAQRRQYAHLFFVAPVRSCQPPIKPGQSFTYEFTARNPGSHMYHSHHNAAKQVALGLLGPVGPALMVSVMLVAAVSAHLKNGLWAQNGGYELNLLFGAVAIGVAFTGPGVLSIDALLGSVPAGLAWGLGATVVAVLGAIGQLAQRQVAETPASAATTSSAH